MGIDCVFKNANLGFPIVCHYSNLVQAFILFSGNEELISSLLCDNSRNSQWVPVTSNCDSNYFKWEGKKQMVLAKHVFSCPLDWLMT